MYPLDDLYLFKQVVDCNGISSASRRLGIAKSTLSRRINALEQRLGVKLFHHSPRQFQLTNFGTLCYEKSVVMVELAGQIDSMAEQLRERPAGRLHIICPPLIGSLLIEEIAVEFARIAPDVQLYLEETAGIYDPRNMRADMVIYPAFKTLEDSTLIARKFLTSPYALVAHPDILAGKPEPAHPQDLAAFNCMGLGEGPGNAFWELNNQQQRYRFYFKPAFIATQPASLLHAARRGLGIASLPTLLIQDDIKQGTLLPVLPHWRPSPVTFFAIYPGNKTITIAARRFLDLLIARSRHLEDKLLHKPQSLSK